MKAKYIFITTLLLSVVFPLRAQLADEDYKTIDTAQIMVLYELRYVEDSTRMDFIKNETMMLLIGRQLSLFKSHNAYRADLMMRQKEKEGLLADWFESTDVWDYAHRYQYEIFKNHPFGRMTVSDYLFLTGYFQYEEDVKLFEWEVLEDTLEIQGYKAQKATCSFGGRLWEAWFTDELPFSDGPYKFGGLPGLILNLSDTKRHYCFEFVSLEVPELGTRIEWHLANQTQTTKKGFFEAEDELRENIMSHFDNRTDIEAQKNAYYVMKSRNNPIELDRK